MKYTITIEKLEKNTREFIVDAINEDIAIDKAIQVAKNTSFISTGDDYDIENIVREVI